MKNFNTPMFMLMLMLGTLITLSASSWMGMWIGLEINLMSFIPMIKNNKISSPSSMMIYFLVQSVSSMILLTLMLINSLIMETPAMMKSIIISMMVVGMLVKLGAPPVHMWMPEMMEKMGWDSCIIMMTWQKIAPMYMISHVILDNKTNTTIISMTVVVGAIGGLNQTSMRKIMAYSSINHLGWMLMMMIYSNTWTLYMAMYALLIIITCSTFKNYNLYNMSQMMVTLSPQEKLINSVNMMSLGGLPPMIGFLPKWMTIIMMMQNDAVMMAVVMCATSLITLFYYLRMISPMMMFSCQMTKWSIKIAKSGMMKMMLMNFMLPMFLILNLV